MKLIMGSFPKRFEREVIWRHVEELFCHSPVAVNTCTIDDFLPWICLWYNFGASQHHKLSNISHTQARCRNAGLPPVYAENGYKVKFVSHESSQSSKMSNFSTRWFCISEQVRRRRWFNFFLGYCARKQITNKLLVHVVHPYVFKHPWRGSIMFWCPT